MINILISKSNSVLSIDWDSMPENAKAHIIEYGLRQKLNDAGSQFTKKEMGENAGAAALGAAENILKSLMAGDVTVRQAAVAQTLEEREAEKLLNSMFKSLFGKDDSKWDLSALATFHKTTVERLQAAIQETAIKRAAVRREELALKAQAKSIEIEL